MEEANQKELNSTQSELEVSRFFLAPNNKNSCSLSALPSDFFDEKSEKYKELLKKENLPEGIAEVELKGKKGIYQATIKLFESFIIFDADSYTGEENLKFALNFEDLYCKFKQKKAILAAEGFIISLTLSGPERLVFQARMKRYCILRNFSDNYKLEAKIGKGGFGVVYEANCTKTFEKFAVKVIEKERVTSKKLSVCSKF